MRKLLLLFFIFLLQIVGVYAQNEAKPPVQEIVSGITQQSDIKSIEKIYLQTDKPFYAINDTLWFKAYLFNAAYLTASTKSGILYLEIANDQNQVIKRVMVSMLVGMGFGNIALTEKDFPKGNYTLTAYTNWMRNFDEHYIFKKQFYINDPGEKDMLISSRLSVKEKAGKQNVEVSLKLNKIDQQPLLLNDFQLKLTEGKKTWYSDKVQTQMSGMINFNFNVPEKADPHKLAITLKNLKRSDENAVYQIPIALNRPENTDLQFMPEGGYLVADVATHIAFKALAEDGNGVNVAGKVYNSKQQEVVSFQSSHSGIGSFDFKPQPGEVYSAKIKLPGGSYSKPYTLPAVKSSGIVLNVSNQFNTDSLEVNITATADIAASNPLYYLIAQSRGVGCYGSVLKLNGQTKRIKINKSIFPTGITRFSLLDARNQSLNERIVYIDHDDHLQIHLSPNKKAYAKRDSVGLDLLVTDKAGKPVQGDFSMAVTDDGQLKTDSLKNNSLKSTILLTSDLKGNVEDPGYYFPPVLTAEIWRNLDNLLLSQGWINYDWNLILQPAKPMLYPAQDRFTVTGKVTNISNKPVEKSDVVLMSKKPSFVRDTVTDKAGIFNFTDIYPSDTAAFFIQARNKKGKSFNVGIEVDEYKPPLFAALNNRIIPWYVNVDTSEAKSINNTAAYKQSHEKIQGLHVLKEVQIKSARIIKGSHNLNEGGGSDFALTQEELQKAGKVTLHELITKYVKGFVEGRGRSIFYFVGNQVFRLIIDGVDVELFAPKNNGDVPFFPQIYRDYYKDFLDSYTAEDIKGIEVMNEPTYAGKYVSRFYSGADVTRFAFIEVTTYAGGGPFLKHTAGTYLYRPLAFTQQKQFYSPKYTVKTDHSFIDSRSTIYWSPNIITDENGKAKISFYTADKPGTYTLLMEGGDMEGNIESARQKIIVKNEVSGLQ